MDYSYPINTSAKIRNGTAKVNGLRLQTALDYSTLKTPSTSNKAKFQAVNTTIDHSVKQTLPIPRHKQSKRYSAVGVSRGNGNISPQDNNLLNITDLYKQYAKQQVNVSLTNSYNYTNSKNHNRAISVVD